MSFMGSIGIGYSKLLKSIKTAKTEINKSNLKIIK